MKKVVEWERGCEKEAVFGFACGELAGWRRGELGGQGVIESLEISRHFDTPFGARTCMNA